MSIEAQQVVHLRVHSQYSLIDSTLSIEQIYDQATKHGMQAVALTDEANIYAAIKFYQQGIKRGIKPIFGVDLWCDHGMNRPCRLTLLCQNQQGYLNLTRLLTLAYQQEQRFHGLPLIQADLLTYDALDGLIALGGGHVGQVGQLLLQGQQDQAIQALKQWQDLLPDQRYYIELQRLGRANEAPFIEAVLPLAEQLNIPVVATHPVCFDVKERYDVHEVRVCIAEGYVLDDPKRPKRHQPSQYFKSGQEMIEAFSDIPEAVMQTHALCQRLNVHFDLRTTYLPNFPVPDGVDVNQHLIEKSQHGLEKRMGQMVGESDFSPQEYQKRLDHELQVIQSMGFAGYFLIVADFITWSREHDIPVGPGRGAGAGSLVAFALGITDIDPLPYGLLFERFLNPERVSMPDFDIDFCMAGRDRVIDYVAERYSRDSVSQIITYGTMAAKAVVRDVGRALSYPYGFVDSIAKLIPMDLGMTLNLAMSQEEELRNRVESDDEVSTLMSYALELEGTVRNVGKHAGGVVIAPSPLTDFTALYYEPGSNQPVTHFDKDDLERIGLVKFDFLGLRNLTIIAEAVEHIHLEGGDKTSFDIQKIPLDDPKTYALLKDCDTTAVFQLESRGMKDLIHRLQPDSFEEIIALVALFRPGPLQSGMVDDFIDRKHGRAQVEFPHPLTADILRPTYGIILYQEQVMQIAQVLAGYTLGAADLLRRAMGKKKPEEMAKQREFFIKGALGNNIDAKVAEGIFDLMEKFAGYGFNKSHSAAYALVAYQTAYLKANHLEAFMAAVLSSDMDNTDKVVDVIDECRAKKIKILAPSINHSHHHFTVSGDQIIYGLGAIKGVGENAIEEILKARAEGGDFKDLLDLCQRIEGRKLNKKVLEALVFSGALDVFDQQRSTLYHTISWALKAADQLHRSSNTHQNDLFGGDQPSLSCQYQTTDDWLPVEQLKREFQALGHYFSGHPMDYFYPELQSMGVSVLHTLEPPEPTAAVKGKRPQRPVKKIAGLVCAIRRLVTKMGKPMMVVTLDDGHVKQEMLVFSEVIDKAMLVMEVNAVVVAKVEISRDDKTQSIRLVAQEVLSFSQARCHLAKSLTVSIDWPMAEKGVLPTLHEMSLPYQGGNTRLYIRYCDQSQKVHDFCCGEAWSLALDESYLDDLLKLLKVPIEFSY